MPVQLVIGLGSVALLLATFYGLGAAIFRACNVAPTGLDAIYRVAAGWGSLVTLSVITGAVHVPLRVTLWSVIAVGLGAIVVLHRPRENLRPLASAGVALLALLPVLVMGAQFGSVQYDEFAHWLPNAFYLFDNDALPSRTLPNPQTNKQGYPIGMPYVTFAISTIAQAWNDHAGKLIPVALAGLFAVLLAGASRRTDQPRFGAVAVATVVVTLLNPFFDPRLAITTYSDVPTAFALAALVFALWRTGEGIAAAAGIHGPAVQAGAIRDGIIGDRSIRDRSIQDWAMRAGACAQLLVHLRETNAALVLAAAVAVPVTAFLLDRPPGLGTRRRAVWRAACIGAACCLGPALLGLVAWRWHIARQGIAPDMAARAFVDWDWSAPTTVLATLVTERLANNRLLGGLAVGLLTVFVVAAVFGWRRTTTADRRLLVLVAILGAAQVGVLGYAYIAVFTPDEVARAASAWRYASQLGPVVMLAAAVVLPLDRLSAAIGARLPAVRRLDWRVSLVVVLGVQTLCAARWRIDCTYPHIRPTLAAVQMLSADIPAGARIVVVNGVDTQMLGGVAGFARLVATRDWRAPRVAAMPPPGVVGADDHVVDLSTVDPTRAAAGSWTATLRRGADMGESIRTITLVPSCAAR